MDDGLDAQHRAVLGVSAGSGQLALELLVEAPAVEQASQLVVVGHVAQPLLVFVHAGFDIASRGRILKAAEDADDVSAGVAVRFCGTKVMNWLPCSLPRPRQSVVK